MSVSFQTGAPIFYHHTRNGVYKATMNRSNTSRESLSQQAYNHIKDALCRGEIVAGDILSENQLAQDLGMSRTPVREALRTLASENWLEIKNGVGAYVKPLSSKDIEDLYEIRCLLEVQAAKTAVYHISNREIDDLEQRFKALLDDYEHGKYPDPGYFSQLDWTLHELIVERCTNNYLKIIMRNNNSNIKRYQLLSFEARNDIKDSTLQHLNILALLRRRDVPALTKALTEHLNWAAAFLKNTY